MKEDERRESVFLALAPQQSKLHPDIYPLNKSFLTSWDIELTASSRSYSRLNGIRRTRYCLDVLVQQYLLIICIAQTIPVRL
jgi:hypothetical protein